MCNLCEFHYIHQLILEIKITRTILYFAMIIFGDVKLNIFKIMTEKIFCIFENIKNLKVTVLVKFESK